MIIIDGGQGEGGGQVLRTSLALSACTGTPFRIENIRAGRAKPGLLRQHLTGVQAAAALCDAQVEGAGLGATALTFQPGALRAGSFEFAIGSAGSANLVVQTVLPMLLRAPGPVSLTVRGGTHNSASPPWHYLARVFLPILRRMGARVETELVRWGFYPAGGGELRLHSQPSALSPLELVERGPIDHRRALAVLAGGLSPGIGRRELEPLVRAELVPKEAAAVLPVESNGPGNVCWLELGAGEVVEQFTAFGERGVPAEAVGAAVVGQAQRWLAADVPVGEHLADQLLLPMALAGGGRLRTTTPSEHTRTNLDVIAAFLPIEATLRELGPDRWEIALTR